MTAAFSIRPMRREDLDVALGWAREEGWNPGREDAGAFFATDASGFLMGWLGDEPAACISVVKYGAAFAFLGLYIVRPAHRGKGHGKAIWDAGMARVAGRTIGLDGVVRNRTITAGPASFWRIGAPAGAAQRIAWAPRTKRSRR